MFREEVANLISKHVKLGKAEIIDSLEIPPNPSLGDYAFPCFTISKNPAEASKELAGKIKDSKVVSEIISEVNSAGPYLNFFIKPDVWGEKVIKEASKDNYGKQKKKEKVMIEYSQPNTHKAFHVGHLRGTSIGESLSRILKFLGYKVYQTNYSGDTGAHIAKWLWYYTKHEKSTPPKDVHELERWIANIYVKAIEILEKEDHEEEVNKILKKIEEGKDRELQKIYKETRKLSIDAFNKIYKELDAHFDYWFFEREVEERGKKISQELLKKGIAEVNEGAIIVDLEKEKLGIWVLLRKDGTALYSAKDLALAEAKFKKYKIDKSIYVVGAAQELHFRQLFATLRKMGFKKAEQCQHLSFAEVRLPEGKMSSRTGKNILYSDIKKDVGDYVEIEVKKRHENWNDKKIGKVVEQVSIAALKYDMLSINPNKNIIFDSKKATEFEGETGPYLQYTFARACSILRKAGKKRGRGSKLTIPKEQELIKLLSRFPEIVEKSGEDLAVTHLANYTMTLAKTFNSFYHDCPVLKSEVEDDRLVLVETTRNILKKCLNLLAIEAPEEM